jgi:hypothetical protein
MDVWNYHYDYEALLLLLSLRLTGVCLVLIETVKCLDEEEELEQQQ